MDYNIEFAHIYADEEFGSEQIEGAKILRQVAQRLDKEGQSYTINILIDEFHPAVFKLDIQNLIHKFKEQGIAVDAVGYESKFCEVSDLLLKELPSHLLKEAHFHKPEKDVLLLEECKGKHCKDIGLEDEFPFMKRPTCALLSAPWSLSRLGLYPLAEGAVTSLTNKEFQAKRLITILPEKYRVVEDKVQEIIGVTKFKDVLAHIQYEYFAVG